MWKVRCADLNGDGCTRHTIKNRTIQKRFRKKCKNCMAIRMSKIAKVFLNLSWEVLLIRNCLRLEFLMTQPKNQYIKNKQLKLKRKKSRTVRIVLLGMMPIKKKFGV